MKKTKQIKDMQEDLRTTNNKRQVKDNRCKIHLLYRNLEVSLTTCASEMQIISSNQIVPYVCIY